MTKPIDSAVDGAFHRVSERRADGARDGHRDAAAGAGAERSTDRLDLTGRAQALRALEEAVASTPEVNASRVSELKEALASGRYEINAERIAEKLLDLESKLP